jgi:hypothetical protein
MSNEKPIHIVALEVNNYGRLKAVRIEPGGKNVVIGGKNRQGKTTVLRAMAAALCGKEEIWEKAVREGEESGNIFIDLGELNVNLSFTKTTSNLTVKSAAGVKQSSPQALLDRLTGGLKFDPLEFSKKDDDKQVEQLRKIVGIDFSLLDDEADRIYAERTAIGRDEKALRGQIAGLKEHSDAPAEESSISALVDELNAAAEENASNEQFRHKLQTQRKNLSDAEEILARLRKQVEAQERVVAAARDAIPPTEDYVAGIQDIDTAPIRLRLQNIQENNRKARENAQRRKLIADADAKAKEQEAITARLKAIDDEKIEQLKNAKFPVPGLSFNKSGVLYNGIPFAQCSGAEQLEISFGIWLSMNPKLRVVMINNGSELDDENLDLIWKMAAEHEVQVWLVRIGHGEECTLIIEDGEKVERQA